MFVRSPGRVTPTEAGRSYATAVGPALAMLLTAAINAQPLRLREVKSGCSRAILNHWLLPRLTRSSGHPARVDVIALERAPKDLSSLDIAIVNGSTDAAPMEGSQLLRREVLVAVGAPSLVSEYGPDLKSSSSLERATLLGSGWDKWSVEAGVTIPAPNAVRLRETSALVAAARAGEGFALLPSMVCADAIRDNQLAVASAITVDRGRGYWLVEPRGRQEHAGELAGWLCDSFASSVEP